LKGGLAVIGGLNLGGSIEIVPDPLDLVELAIEKGANAVLMPVSCRRALVDLSDEAAAKIQTIFYLDPGDALRKALHDG
jgi:ATP-dependent Lon protease